jgi:hypothetical protein
MKSAFAVDAELLQRWLKTFNLLTVIIHVSIKLVPKSPAAESNGFR